MGEPAARASANGARVRALRMAQRVARDRAMRRTARRFHIRAAGPQALAAEFSGGNRQRLCVARALESRPRVLVAHNITRGLDLAATAEVHRMLRAFAGEGGAVLLISSDLDELLALCGRLAVISRGRCARWEPLSATRRGWDC